MRTTKWTAIAAIGALALHAPLAAAQRSVLGADGSPTREAWICSAFGYNADDPRSIDCYPIARRYEAFMPDTWRGIYPLVEYCKDRRASILSYRFSDCLAEWRQRNPG